MQKHFVWEHGEREVKASNQCIALRKKRQQFMVAVLHSNGIVKCYQYKGRINEEKFVKFIDEHFPDMSLKWNNKKGKLFHQDGDPSENYKI